MQFHLFFSYGTSDEWEFIYQHLNKNYRNSRIIVQNDELTKFLVSKGLNASTFDYALSDEIKIEEVIYTEAKLLLEKFRSVFGNISFKGISIFKGFEYSFLRELLMLVRMRKILDSQRHDTVVIFTRFYFIYFAMQSIANISGYDSMSQIGFINDNKIEYVNHNDENLISTVGNKFKLIKAKKYLKSSTTGKPFREKVRESTQFYIRVISFVLKLLRHKIKSTAKMQDADSMLLQINNKIIHKYRHLESDCLLCITSVREDLYLKPWKPVFEKFRQESKKFQVITSDLSSSLMLSKQDIPFIDLFEEVNVMTEIIRKSEDGVQIEKKLKDNIKENSSIEGIEKLSTYFLSQSFRSAAIILILEYLITKSNPKSAIAAADGEMLECILSEVTRKFKIPSFSILPGAVVQRPLFADWFHADKIFVAGTKGSDLLNKLGYNKDRIVITGNPKYDYIKNLDSNKSKISLSNQIGIDPKKKLILVIMSRWHDNDEIWMSDLIKFCNKNNLEIIIKIHPLYKREDNHVSEDKINVIKNNCNNLHFHIGYDYNLTELLSASDIILTEYSDAGIEAILLGKLLITVNFANEDFDKYINFHKYNAAIYVDTYDELEQNIQEILKDKKPNLDSGVKKTIEMYNSQNDGKATERIFRMLTINNNSI